MDLDVFSAGRYTCDDAGASARVAARAGAKRTSHRYISIYLFFTEHAFAGGSGGLVFSGHAVSGFAPCSSLEAARVAGDPGGGAQAGTSRRLLFRTVHLLSRVRAGFLPACADSGCAERRCQASQPSDRSIALKQSGLYLMADAETGQQALIDAGPQGPGTAGHGHADALNITLVSNGRSLLMDPGTLEYVGESHKDRAFFRGT